MAARRCVQGVEAGQVGGRGAFKCGDAVGQGGKIGGKRVQRSGLSSSGCLDLRRQRGKVDGNRCGRKTEGIEM